jgi:GTPase KRas protein
MVLGDGGVGKTASVIQYCSNHFVDEYDPTIEDSYRKQTTIDDEVCLLEMLDTAGPEEFTALREQWMLDCEGFLILYSITSRPSFEQVSVFIDQCLRVKDKDVLPMVIAGNKVDLEDEREVSTQEGKDLVGAKGALFFEMSAKTRVNIEEVFHGMVREIRAGRKGYVNLGLVVKEQIVYLILCGKNFDKKCAFSKLDVNVVRLIAKMVLDSRRERGLWKSLIEREQAKQMKGGGEKKKCVIQ